MAVQFTTLRGKVLQHCPEVPIVMVLNALRESSREFFTRSKAWVAQFDMTLVAAQASYELKDHTNNASFPYNATTSTFDADVSDWHDVRINTNPPLIKLTSTQLFKRAPVQDSGIIYYSTAHQSTIKLYGTPGTADAGDTLKMLVSLTPSRTADNINEDRLVDKYENYIIAGALRYLMMIPRQPWTDLRTAAVHDAIFENGILAANNDAQAEYTQRITRTTRYGGIP